MSKQFKSITVDTPNVSKELKYTAVKYNMDVSELDFALISYQTFYKAHEEEKWIEVNSDNEKFLEDEAFLLNEDLKFRQLYKINIFLKEEIGKSSLNIVLGANSIVTRVVATIKMNMDLEYSTSLARDIIDFISKKKLLSGIMIGIFEDQLKPDLKKALLQIKEDNAIMDDFKVVISSGINPKQSINEQIKFLYKEKNKNDGDKVDYSKGELAEAVKNSENIIEHIKPKDGHPGRDCKGRFIPIKPAIQMENFELKVDEESITTFELDDRISCIAKKDGYVSNDNGIYKIVDTLEINSLSLKGTGSVEAGLDKNISIDLKEQDILKDAIGSGVKVEVDKINVEGNMGNNSEIIANYVSIGGQTHNNSKIEAKNAIINVHKGYLKAIDVEVTSLEAGQIDASLVRIGRAIGGNVTGEKIYIENMMSNVKIIALDLIEIDNIKGSDNQLIIDQGSISGYDERVKPLKDEMVGIKDDLKVIPKNIIQLSRNINNNRDAAKLIEVKIRELNSKGHTIPKPLIMKLKLFNEQVVSLKKLRKLKVEYENRIEYLSKELNVLQESIFSAKIRCKNGWSEGNKIIFKLIQNDISIEYVTQENEKAKEFYLKTLEDGDYKVASHLEFTE